MSLNETLKLLERAKKTDDNEGVVNELAKYELWISSQVGLTSHHEDKFFHPSAISKMCERCLTYKFIKNPQTGKLFIPNKTRNPDSIRRMDNGTYVHKRLQNSMMKAGLVKIQRYKKNGEPDAEVEISIPALKIIGHADGEFTTHLNSIWEIKSINERGWISLTKPLPEHRVQGTIYAHAKKRKYCIFWYENKNTQKPKRFVVPYSREIMVQVKDLCLLAMVSIKKGELGKRYRGASMKNLNCKWCEWSQYCWRLK